MTEVRAIAAGLPGDQNSALPGVRGKGMAAGRDISRTYASSASVKIRRQPVAIGKPCQ